MRTLTLAALTGLCLLGCKKDEPTPPAAPAPPPAAAQAQAARAEGVRVVSMEVTNDGFVPASVTLKAGEPVKLLITRRTDETCATEILIEGTDIKADLPLGKTVEVAWTPKAGGKVKFGCAMDMMIGGVLVVE
jgi:plastocyanin domain-containing protein